MHSEVRQPAVAGKFYSADARTLAEEVARNLSPFAKPRPAIGVMVPHAGYVYSAKVAGQVFSQTIVPARVIVLGPNHTGHGALDAAALWPSGSFAIPGATIPVDVELAELISECDVVRVDRLAHRFEHSLEVELPFLHAREPAVRITPLVLGPLSYDECARLGRSLAAAVSQVKDEVLVCASSDMSHYLDDTRTRKLDHLAIEPILNLDARALFQTVERESISMCGVIPTTVMLEYARARGASKATLIDYATSGDAFGDRERVVGYAGIIVE